MKRLVKMESGWIAIEIAALENGALFVSLVGYDREGRCVRDDLFDEYDDPGDDVADARELARRLEDYGAAPPEAQRWADELVREAHAERQETEELRAVAGRHVRAFLEMVAVVLATIGVWLVGVGFLLWLVVTRVF